MGKRHTNRVLGWYGNRTRPTDPLSAVLPDQHFLDELCTEISKGDGKFGGFNSPHELYGIILEELDEFWDSVKADDPDPKELLQVAAVAVRGALQLAAQGRAEMEKNNLDAIGEHGLSNYDESARKAREEVERTASGKGGSGKWSENTERRNQERQRDMEEEGRRLYQRSFDRRLRAALDVRGFRFVSKQVGRDEKGVYISGAVTYPDDLVAASASGKGDVVAPFKVYRPGDIETTWSDEMVVLIADTVEAEAEEARARAQEKANRDVDRDSFKDRLRAALGEHGFEFISQNLGRNKNGLSFSVAVRDKDGAVMSVDAMVPDEVDTWSDEMVLTIVAAIIQKVKDLKNE
jgi:hypothetical protein